MNNRMDLRFFTIRNLTSLLPRLSLNRAWLVTYRAGINIYYLVSVFACPIPRRSTHIAHVHYVSNIARKTSSSINPTYLLWPYFVKVTHSAEGTRNSSTAALSHGHHPMVIYAPSILDCEPTSIQSKSGALEAATVYARLRPILHSPAFNNSKLGLW